MADTTNELNRLERVMRDTIRELREHPESIPQYVTEVERVMRDRARLLSAIPECPVHGQYCMAYALEWLNEQKRKGATDMAQKGQNGRSTSGAWGSDGQGSIDPNTLDRIVKQAAAPYEYVKWQEIPFAVPPDQVISTGPRITQVMDEYEPTKGERARAYLRFAAGEAWEAVKLVALCVGDVMRAVRTLVRGR